MTSIAQSQRSVFTVHRGDQAVFCLESRAQGQVRKVTQATYEEEIMGNDSIKITVSSTILLQFRLRDYLIYRNKPYFLNTPPECSIDEKRRYTYKLTFEGVMFELSRVAFTLQDSIGYEYYGSLSDFGSLVVDNMNRVNSYVSWVYHGVTYSAKFNCTETLYDHGTPFKAYLWGVGANHDLEGFCETWVYTVGFPSVGDYVYDPDSGELTDIAITMVRRWQLSFPHDNSVPAVYPAPSGHAPTEEIAIEWGDPEYKSNSDMMEYLADFVYNNLSLVSEDGSKGKTCTLVANYGIHYDTFPTVDPAVPRYISDSCTKYQDIHYKIHVVSWKLVNGVQVTTEEHDTIMDGRRKVIWRAEKLVTTWGYEPIVPPSGYATEDYLPTESRLLSYDQNSCLSVLQDICGNKWEGWEWKIGNVTFDCINGEMLVNATIVINKKEDIVTDPVVHVMGFGKSGGLKSVTRKHANESNIPSRIYFYGGTQNLPQYYRNTRLCLPGFGKNESYMEFGEFDEVTYPMGIENKTCEEIICFNEIFPACNPFVIRDTWRLEMVTRTDPYGIVKHYLLLNVPLAEFFEIDADWTYYDFEQGTTDEKPDYLEWLQFKNYVDTGDHRNDYNNYYANRSKYLIAGESPMFTFQTGAIAGYSLSLHHVEYDNNYIMIYLNVVKENNEEVGSTYTPNVDLCCNIGDKFIVENINMPVSYTYYRDGSDSDYSAENMLYKKAFDYMVDKAEEIDDEVEVERSYVINNEIAFNCFERLSYPNPLTVDGETVDKRIESVSLDLVDGYTYKLKIANHNVIKPLFVIANILNQQHPNQ